MDPVSRINVQHLKYLVALVKERHVTRAATSMGIGQPAMSTALGKLRTLFGDPLLVKTTAGMVPTARALSLARRAQDAIDLLSGDPLSAETFTPETCTAHLNLMVSDGIIALMIPSLMQKLGEQAPNITITLISGDIRRTAELLSNGEVDYVLGFINKTSDYLYQTQLYNQELVCIASKDHSRIQGSISLEQYMAESHVTWGAYPIPQPTLELLIDEELLKLDLRRNVSISLPSIATSPGIVASTELITTLPEKSAHLVAQNLPLQILPLPFKVPKIEVSMLWHERWHRSPAHIWFRSLLKEIAATT